MPSLEVVNLKMTYVEALRAISRSYGVKLVVEPGIQTTSLSHHSYSVWWVRFVEDIHRREWSGMPDMHYLRFAESVQPFSIQIVESLMLWEKDLDLYMKIAH